MMFAYNRPRRRGLLLAWAIETAQRVLDTARGQSSSKTPDPDDLSALVSAHGESIYRVCLSVVRDASLAEDVAQDTLVKAWLALPTFRGESSLKSWVLRIARNTAISTIRSNRMIVMDPFTMPEEEPRADGSVERKVENREAMQDFVVALGELDDLSRSVVVLREIEGLPYDEIADVLDVPLSTVKTRLMRARKRLGSALEEWAP
ncbi:MAG: RNA polymerase sigma factor [Acidimicrobiia bacterium]